MDNETSEKFIQSLAKSMHSLCNGYATYDKWVHITGHLYFSVDTGDTIEYVVNEKMSKIDANCVSLSSNSFHAQRVVKSGEDGGSKEVNVKPELVDNSNEFGGKPSSDTTAHATEGKKVSKRSSRTTPSKKKAGKRKKPSSDSVEPSVSNVEESREDSDATIDNDDYPVDDDDLAAAIDSIESNGGEAGQPVFPPRLDETEGEVKPPSDGVDMNIPEASVDAAGTEGKTLFTC